MKDILKVMRFDFLTSWAMFGKAVACIVAFCLILGLFFSPIICVYLCFFPMVLIVPLQAVAEKSGFRKLYGLLPVSRQSIPRGRFLLFFVLFLVSELTALAGGALSMSLRLFRFIPAGSDLYEFVADSFDDKKTFFMTLIGMHFAMFLIFSYMEMMGQIFGRENEMRIITITLGIVAALLVGFFVLSDNGVLPLIQFPSAPETIAGWAVLGIIAVVVMLGIAILFGEITCRKVTCREL